MSNQAWGEGDALTPTNSKGTATLSYGSAAVNTFTGFYDGVNVILTSVRTGL